MKTFTNGHYYSFNQFLKEKFGCKVYKLSLNGGFTCPNRDGTLDSRGCIFCSAGGSGEFAQSPKLDINSQIEAAKKAVEKKIKNGKYIAYFQAFTNTYAPVDYLKKFFTQAIQNPDIAAISIATRPDCLGEDVLELLARLNSIKPIFVELGLQTIHPKTAEYIRRGYDLSVYDTAVKNLKSLNINTVVHVILGLPFETKDMILQTVEYVCSSGIDGIKLQLLHVLKNTDLADDYQKGLFEVLSLASYADLVCSCLEIIPENIVIHRLTGDGAKRILIAPFWSANKKNVLNYLNKTFDERGIIQGSKYRRQQKFITAECDFVT